MHGCACRPPSRWQGALQIANGLLSAHHDTLVSGWQKPVTPIGLAIGGFASHIGYGDIGRQVFIGRAQRIAHPCSGAGETSVA